MVYKKHQNLLKRTLSFSENIIDLIVKIPKSLVNIPIIKQVVRSATSIGANYREACEAESSKDFIHKLKISLKETRETQYWLKLLQKTNPKNKTSFYELEKETIELTKIFSSIIFKFKRK